MLYWHRQILPPKQPFQSDQLDNAERWKIPLSREGENSLYSQGSCKSAREAVSPIEILPRRQQTVIEEIQIRISELRGELWSQNLLKWSNLEPKIQKRSNLQPEY